jgi:hypothetical protein
MHACMHAEREPTAEVEFLKITTAGKNKQLQKAEMPLQPYYSQCGSRATKITIPILISAVFMRKSCNNYKIRSGDSERFTHL